MQSGPVSRNLIRIGEYRSDTWMTRTGGMDAPHKLAISLHVNQNAPYRF
jgi:hypothetical protein